MLLERFDVQIKPCGVGSPQGCKFPSTGLLVSLKINITMNKLLIILLSALSLTAFAQQKKVAVYVTGDDTGINKVLGSKLVAAIAKSDEYSAVERTESFLAELNKEQNYQRTGSVDDSEYSRIGKQFGVQYVCVAAVSDAFNEKYLSARLIDVETAQVERTASSSGVIQSLEDIVNAANSVSTDLLASLGKNRSADSKKVAVYIIKNEAGKDIGRVLGDKLVAGFTKSGRYIAIERTNSFLSQLSKEQKYQQSGAVDDSEISRLGKQFGVQYVCVADVSDVLGEKYISARLVDVETAEVVNSHDVGGKLKDMNSCLEMTNEIAINLSKGTFKEQAEEKKIREAEEARLQAERDAASKEEQERENRTAKQRQQQEQLQNSMAQLGTAISNALNPQYYLKVTNNRLHTRVVVIDGQKIGTVAGLSVKTFTVPTKYYKKIEMIQKEYVISPSIERFTNNNQPTNGQIVEIVDNPL